MVADRWPASMTCSSSCPIKNRCSANSVPTPMPTHTTASRLTSVTSNRARSDQARGERSRRSQPGRLGSVAGFEDIACAAKRINHRRPTAIDLLAQVRHVQFDDVGPPTEVVTPDPVEDLRLAQYFPRVAHHESQQLEFCCGERNLVAAAGHFVAVFVKHQVADDDLRTTVLAGDSRAAQQRP